MNAVERPSSARIPPPEVQAKLSLSAAETDGMAMRDIKCPYCGYIVSRVFADVRGHFLARCRKCKKETIINLEYFRRQRGIHRRRYKYRGKRRTRSL